MRYVHTTHAIVLDPFLQYALVACSVAASITLAAVCYAVATVVAQIRRIRARCESAQSAPRGAGAESRYGRDGAEDDVRKGTADEAAQTAHSSAKAAAAEGEPHRAEAGDGHDGADAVDACGSPAPEASNEDDDPAAREDDRQAPPEAGGGDDCIEDPNGLVALLASASVDERALLAI